MYTAEQTFRISDALVVILFLKTPFDVHIGVV